MCPDDYTARFEFPEPDGLALAKFRRFRSKELDGLVYDEAPNVFLCCPQALAAVNKHRDFTGHAATLELAETEVGEDHWSRRNGG